MFLTLQCGKSNCKKYTERFCQAQGAAESADCTQAKARAKDWSSNTCRIELNKILIEDQSKNLDKELQ